MARYRLSELRQALGVTQAESAELIGRSQSAVLPLEMLWAIVAQLGGRVEISAVFDDRRVLLDT